MHTRLMTPNEGAFSSLLGPLFHLRQRWCMCGMVYLPPSRFLPFTLFAPTCWYLGSAIRFAATPPHTLYMQTKQSYVKLFARDVHGLGTLEGIDDSHVLHGNKAVHRVQVSGIVVHIKPGATKAFGSYGEQARAAGWDD